MFPGISATRTTDMDDDAIRRQVQDQLRNHPDTQKVTEQQVTDYTDRTRINNEIERQRLERERGN
jgi:hypothetical protein